MKEHEFSDWVIITQDTQTHIHKHLSHSPMKTQIDLFPQMPTTPTMKSELCKFVCTMQSTKWRNQPSGSIFSRQFPKFLRKTSNSFFRPKCSKINGNKHTRTNWLWVMLNFERKTFNLTFVDALIWICKYLILFTFD